METNSRKVGSKDPSVTNRDWCHGAEIVLAKSRGYGSLGNVYLVYKHNSHGVTCDA